MFGEYFLKRLMDKEANRQRIPTTGSAPENFLVKLGTSKRLSNRGRALLAGLVLSTGAAFYNNDVADAQVPLPPPAPVDGTGRPPQVPPGEGDSPRGGPIGSNPNDTLITQPIPTAIPHGPTITTSTGQLIIEKFNDRSGDGIRHAGEEGLVWPFTVIGPSGSFNLTTADGVAGIATRTVTAGVHTVCEVLNPGWQTTTGSLCKAVIVPSGGSGRVEGRL
ncbi:MAG: hypothetical protein WD988_00275 [Candidatus Curtissbacteria bacterium]